MMERKRWGKVSEGGNVRGKVLLGIAVALLLAGCDFIREESPVVAVIRTDPSPPRGDPPLEVRFSARDSVGDIVEFLWDFGDGNGAKGKVVEHVYPRPGNYTVTLEVKGADGSEDVDSIGVHVNSEPPVISYFYADRYIVHVGHDLRFYVDAYDPDGEVRFLHWDFGDGETATTPVTGISHIYTEPGIYEVSVQAEDDNGDLSEPFSLRIEVLPRCPCDSGNG